jgi:hypothetical protein
MWQIGWGKSYRLQPPLKPRIQFRRDHRGGERWRMVFEPRSPLAHLAVPFPAGVKRAYLIPDGRDPIGEVFYAKSLGVLVDFAINQAKLQREPLRGVDISAFH